MLERVDIECSVLRWGVVTIDLGGNHGLIGKVDGVGRGIGELPQLRKLSQSGIISNVAVFQDSLGRTALNGPGWEV